MVHYVADFLVLVIFVLCLSLSRLKPLISFVPLQVESRRLLERQKESEEDVGDFIVPLLFLAVF